MASPLNVVAEGPLGAPEATRAPEVADAPPGSVLARLRARAASERRDRTLDVPVGGRWGADLVVRYRMPSMEDADRFVAAGAAFAAGTGQAPSMGGLSIDMMATCCVTILGAREDGGLEDLERRLDGRLLELLALSLPPGVDKAADVTVREVVEELFDGNWVAVNVHAGRILGWLNEGTVELGEASAGP
jgi:hypothetical protein